MIIPNLVANNQILRFTIYTLKLGHVKHSPKNILQSFNWESVQNNNFSSKVLTISKFIVETCHNARQQNVKGNIFISFENGETINLTARAFLCAL